jgi:hypothetical protein
MASGYRLGNIHPSMERNMGSTNKRGTCGCGRSPTGDCIGWHKLSESEYQSAKSQWELERYKEQARNIWNDSCTSGKAE